ncbi:unnamed protein product [Paramecium sonneborni]|uniref:Uncharacterized protein n=1 Tax=Paramecium sonneborni TaxID=65129 RepID=A0A8S1PVH2_9CILI|nr:unnamed protein product [Paramecium sonneborni]
MQKSNDLQNEFLEVKQNKYDDVVQDRKMSNKMIFLQLIELVISILDLIQQLRNHIRRKCYKNIISIQNQQLEMRIKV